MMLYVSQMRTMVLEYANLQNWAINMGFQCRSIFQHHGARIWARLIIFKEFVDRLDGIVLKYMKLNIPIFVTYLYDIDNTPLV